MKEKMIEFLNHVNVINEAYMLLYSMANDEDLEEKKQRYTNFYSKNLDLYFKKYEAILKIYHHVKDHLNEEKESIVYLFKEQDKNMCSIASFCLLWNIKQINYTLDDYKEDVVHGLLEKRIEKMVSIIESERREFLEDKTPQNLEEFIDFLNQTSYNPDFCWNLINILKYPEVYFEKVERILIKTMDLIEDCKEEIAFLEQTFFDYWTERNSKENLFTWLQERFNVFWPISKKGCVVIPCIFRPFSLTISLDEVSNRSEDVIHMGAMLDERLTIELGGLSIEEVSKIGKAIGDKSKLDILEFVGKKPAFGKEIAKQLGLTTATISYHVNALVDVGFLKTELISGRVYYSADIPRIIEKLDLLKAYFYRKVDEKDE